VYDPSEQIFPVSERVQKYFKSKKYMKKFNEIYKKKKYSFDYRKMTELRAQILKKKNPADL